jgi:NADH:ubiquinone oxidoreductase subunit 2 (subunit N)
MLGTNVGFNFLFSNTQVDSQSFLEYSLFNKAMLSIEYIKVQELTFLAEYYLITILFCLTLFALFSFKLITNEKHFLIKFQYNNQLIFLLIFGLSCYLILVYQQFNLSLLTLTSFNDTIYNDQLSLIAKLIIGVSSIIYFIFITQYLKDQKLNNFEYYIIILTSIFGFFLLCGANDLITAYLAIELQGLAFYVLASFKKSSNFSIESGVKYFVLGSLSTAIFLLGVTFIYGFSGSVLLTDFKDFFIWVFSTNSAILSLESIFDIFNSFQEKIDSNTSSNCLNLKIVSDKFDFFKSDSVMPFNDNIMFHFINNLESVNDVTTFFEMLCCYQLLADLELVDSSFFDQNDISHTFLKININSLSNLFVNTELNSDSYFMTDVSFVVSGMLIILLALFFKLALAPFHLWSPDVYEGSPSSSTFFFMIISKFSLFVFLLRLCYSSFYSLISYWQFYSLLIATISIFVGAVAGLKQRKLKSLLTYSSINNMGFVLLAFSIGGFEGIQMKFYYLIVYILSGLCIWAIILNLKLHKKMYFEKQNRDIGDLALLQESNNTVAQSLGITLFTLAGLPPMVGFLAKMGVFKALSGVSIYFFSLINILFSVIATFYYIRIVKIIFFENILIGNLYVTINTKKTFIINLLTFLLIFLFVSPMFLYFYSYKITLFLNKSFY